MIKIRLMLLSVLLSLSATQVLAQSCQVQISRPDIQLGSKLYSAKHEGIFDQQALTVTAECPGGIPLSLLVDGALDQRNQAFGFGNAGQMTLTLQAARYNDAPAELRVSTPQKGEQRLTVGQTMQLPPGSRITPVSLNRESRDHQRLTLELRIDFPVSGKENRVRDLTEMDGQIRITAQQ